MAGKRRVVRALGRAAGAIHIGVYRRSGGRRGGRVKGIPVLLITTTGRRSGQERTQPVCYCLDGDGYVVAGTNGGMKHPPCWSLNLRNDPAARIQVGPDMFDVTATEATGAEYDRLWAAYVEQHPPLAKYPRKTTRRIAVWQLEPVPAPAATPRSATTVEA
jgi:deazaflavin-dependent oxidoreductase (nitroreductase family)